ncbi:MAG: ATP-binding cassette domain-containing protein, partial [Stellaceae bacterium]
ATKATTKVASLSGGERARLMLALATLDKPNLLILDEPTNHLDIDARNELLTALNDFAGAVILVSHDRRLLEATADRLMLVADGRVTPFDGDLDDYRRFLLSPGNTATRTIDAGMPAPRRDGDRRRRLKPLKQRADAAEREVGALTARLSQLDAQLAAPDLFTRDPAAAAALAKTRADAARALATAEARWVQAQDDYDSAAAE